MRIDRTIEIKVVEGLKNLFNIDIPISQVVVQRTKKEFEGDFTIVVFPFIRLTKKQPVETATMLGDYLISNIKDLSGFNVIQGFLNLVVNASMWIDYVHETLKKPDFGQTVTTKKETVILEYSSPNTNKPLHLGHVRNIFIGNSVASILQANGYTVIQMNLVNDRGIHICKSMIAWQKWGNGETPQSSGIKGDHFIGKYYVLFDQHLKAEIKDLMAQGKDEEQAANESPLMLETREMLRKWEAGDEQILQLWKLLNSWTYDGFNATYERMGIHFDEIQYESETYLLGKKNVEEGVKNGILTKKSDNSVWIDLTAEGLDEKLLLRSDGTSVYITQDIGTAIMRHNKYQADSMIYVVGNEQDYHFEVLKLSLKKLGYQWADSIYHLSYGMVELPHGKMKSREGTVVDADDLMDEMIETAMAMACELGKIDEMTPEEGEILCKTIAFGALKYFILKIDPKKKMMFVPEESIDFNGNTGPFIQYTHARICSLLKKAEEKDILDDNSNKNFELSSKEKEIIKSLYVYPDVVAQAGVELSPALLANFLYELAKEYNQFYHDIPILKEQNPYLMDFRLRLSELVGKTIKNGMKMLGITVPEKM